jgi:hypothetical protein
VDCHVLSYWHIHQDQPLCEREKKKQQAKKKYIERHLGEKERKVQRSNAQTKKKGKDSPSPDPVLLSLLLTEGSLAAVFIPIQGMMPNSKQRELPSHSVELPHRKSQEYLP